MYTKYKIVPFCPYHFVRTILSNTILSVYHFVRTILSATILSGHRLYTYMYIHCVRMKSSTPQKVSQLVQNCKYLPEILNSTTVTISTRDLKAVLKYW